MQHAHPDRFDVLMGKYVQSKDDVHTYTHIHTYTYVHTYIHTQIASLVMQHAHPDLFDVLLGEYVQSKDDVHSFLTSILLKDRSNIRLCVDMYVPCACM